MALQGADGGARRVHPPQCLHEPGRGDGEAGAQGEEADEGALPGAAQDRRAGGADGLDRAEQPQLHTHRTTHPAIHLGLTDSVSTGLSPNKGRDCRLIATGGRRGPADAWVGRPPGVPD
ncbi:hypothetical protein Lfu02_36050 [Longispora fulva]|nr:hypothetical protein Lfu02_36050 [Longispora fulva]